MNKKQLIVAWIATTLICITLIFFPKTHRADMLGRTFYYSEPLENRTIPITQWGYVTPICIAIFLEGLFIILILGYKKK